MFCNSCGRQNPDDAKFCSQCAAPILSGQPSQPAGAPAAPVPPSPPPPQGVGDRIGRDMSAAADRFEQRMERAGERFGKNFERFGEEWGHWFDRTFGVLVPLFGALVGVVVLVVLAAIARHIGLHNVSAFFVSNIALFFILMIVFGYASFAQKRYRRETRWSAPITTAVGLATFLWILSEVHYALWLDTGFYGLDTISLILRVLVFVALVLVMIIGYVFIYVIIPRERTAQNPPPGQVI